MKTKTTIDSAKNMGNVVQFDEGESTLFWLSYRKDGGSSTKQLRIASSPDGRSWTVSKWDGIGVTPRSDFNPQLVVTGNEMFHFWMDDNKNKLLATKRAPDPSNPSKFIWFDFVECQNTEGDKIKKSRTGGRRDAVLGAILVGENILVSVLNEDSIDYYLFPIAPTAYDASNKKLTAVKQSSVSVSDVNGLFSFGNLENFRKRNAMTFFSIDPDNTVLVQAIDIKHTNGTDRIVILQLKLEVLETGYGLPKTPLEGSAKYWSKSTDNTMALVRDPGGRIVATFRNSEDKPFRDMMDTSQFPGDFGPGSLRAEMDTSKVSQNPIVFYSFAPGTIAHIEGKRIQERAATEWVLQTDNSEKVFTEDNTYGKLQRVFKEEQVNLTEESDTRTIFVHGYIDGPPPVFKDMENPLSSVNYAVTSSKENSFELATNVTIGSQSSGDTATAVGTIGPAWETSLKIGVAAAFKVQDLKSVDENTIFQLERAKDGGFAQKGLVRSSEILLTRDVFWFIPEGEETPAINAPEFSQIYLEILPDGKTEFDLGTVTVGDLKSYTVSEWNDRMLGLPFYEGVEDYIDEIVMPRVVRFRDGTPTLSDTWTPGSPVKEKFQSTSSTYTSASLTLEQSTFVGVSANFLGAKASAMVGFEASVSATKESTSSDGFGVSMTIDGGIGGSVAKYRASTYLLSASNFWIKELLAFQSEEDKARGFTIQEDSSCWKIMYVVDQILYNDPVRELNLPPNVLESLEAREIFTTQDLLQSLNMDYPDELRDNIDSISDPEEVVLLNALRKWDAERNIYEESQEG